MRNDILLKVDSVNQWILERKSKAFMCRKLGCKPETLERYLKILGIVYRGNKGQKGKTANNKKSALEYSRGTYVGSHKLKVKMLKEGIREKRCEICHGETWLGRDIPLELHHIDGNRFNNDFNNLQILCPNCHTLQGNNSGKAVGNYARVMERQTWQA